MKSGWTWFHVGGLSPQRTHIPPVLETRWPLQGVIWPAFKSPSSALTAENQTATTFHVLKTWSPVSRALWSFRRVESGGRIHMTGRIPLKGIRSEPLLLYLCLCLSSVCVCVFLCLCVSLCLSVCLCVCMSGGGSLCLLAIKSTMLLPAIIIWHPHQTSKTVEPPNPRLETSEL